MVSSVPSFSTMFPTVSFASTIKPFIFIISFCLGNEKFAIAEMDMSEQEDVEDNPVVPSPDDMDEVAESELDDDVKDSMDDDEIVETE